MKKNLKLGEFIKRTMNPIVFIFVLVFSMFSCQIEETYTEKTGTGEQKGDTTLVWGDNSLLNHNDWTFTEGLVFNDPVLSGVIEYFVKSNGTTKLVKSDDFYQKLHMQLSWDKIEEITSDAPMFLYSGQKTSDAKIVETVKSQNATISTMEAKTTLSFLGREIIVKGQYQKANIGDEAGAYCRWDSCKVFSQVSDTLKEEILVGEMRKKRVINSLTVRNYLTDMPGKKDGIAQVEKKHTEDMTIVGSQLCSIIIKPGEKVYQGSIMVEGSGSYKLIAGSSNYNSKAKFTSYYVQDGKTSTTMEEKSGTAVVKTWVEEKGPKTNIPAIKIGNPTFKVSESISEPYAKGDEIEAVKHTRLYTYTWTNGYQKIVHAEFEKLFFVREGKKVAMPAGETDTAFDKFIEGNPVEKTENDLLYDTYPEGMISFTGRHHGDYCNDVIELSVGQEFWVAKEKPVDKLLSRDVTKDIGATTGISTITITKMWSISGKDVKVYSMTKSFILTVDGKQRVDGNILTFVSGLSKKSNDPAFELEGNNIHTRTVVDTYTAKFNLLDSHAMLSRKEGYVMDEGQREDFLTETPSVEYKGLNTPVAQIIESGLNRISRLSYEITYSETLKNTTKVALVDVEEVLANIPTLPDEVGPIDWLKTKQFGGLSWYWAIEGQAIVPHIAGSIITAAGVMSFEKGAHYFRPMDINTINDRVGAVTNAAAGNKLVPSYVNILRNPNPYWYYAGFDNFSTATINGVDILTNPKVDLNKPFFEIPSDASTSTYHFSNGRLVVTYNGDILFDEVFPASK